MSWMLRNEEYPASKGKRHSELFYNLWFYLPHRTTLGTDTLNSRPGVQHPPECQSTQAPPEKRCHISLRTLDGFSPLCQGMLINLFTLGKWEEKTYSQLASLSSPDAGTYTACGHHGSQSYGGSIKGEHITPRSEAGGPLLPLWKWEVFPTQLSRRSSAAQVALNTVSSKGSQYLHEPGAAMTFVAPVWAELPWGSRTHRCCGKIQTFLRQT